MLPKDLERSVGALFRHVTGLLTSAGPPNESEKGWPLYRDVYDGFEYTADGYMWTHQRNEYIEEPDWRRYAERVVGSVAGDAEFQECADSVARAVGAQDMSSEVNGIVVCVAMRALRGHGVTE